MNAVGIDVSKGKSMIAVMRPFGEVVASPFEVQHTDSELSKLAKLLKSLDGETRVVMESTSNYHEPAVQQSQLESMAARSGQTLWTASGIVSTFARFLRNPLRPNTRSGAGSMATISARIRRWTSMPLPVVISASCRKPRQQRFLWNRLFLNSEQLLPL